MIYSEYYWWKKFSTYDPQCYLLMNFYDEQKQAFVEYPYWRKMESE